MPNRYYKNKAKPILNKKIFFCLLLSAVAVFLGRGWQHLWWDAPWRALFWDEYLLGNWVERMTRADWEEFATSPVVDGYINCFIKGVGVLFLLCSVACCWLTRSSIARWTVGTGTAFLIVLAGLYCKERFFSIGQFFEYTLQFSSPIFLWLVWKQGVRESYLFLLKIAIALTFTCHGLYAVGYYPIPANFLEMTMNILPVNQSTAYQFLTLAGVLDFVVSAGLFLPKKWNRPFFYYAILWGILTTAARIVANWNIEWLDDVLLRWFHEALMRVPHFLLPLAGLWMSQLLMDRE